jgi:presenilin-like A22 family membrane protease
LLAIALAGEAEWYVIVGLGAIMGVLAAALFGMLGGVTLVAHVLEDVDKGSPGVH